VQQTKTCYLLLILAMNSRFFRFNDSIIASLLFSFISRFICFVVGAFAYCWCNFSIQSRISWLLYNVAFAIPTSLATRMQQSKPGVVSLSRTFVQLISRRTETEPLDENLNIPSSTGAKKIY
jgi:hypothetical protein